MITVLGATGLIGSHLVRKLAESGTDHLAPRRGEELAGKSLGDIIYCIGMTADFRSRPFETVDAHVYALRDVLEGCAFDSLLYLSSARVYAGGGEPAREDDALRVAPVDPDHLYNISKAMGESLALGCGRNTRVARLSNVFGTDFESDNFLSAVIRDAVTTGRVILQTAPESAKDYVDIDDVVDGLLDIATRGRHRLYNLASGANTSNGALMRGLEDLTGCRVEVAPGAPATRFPLIDIGRMRSEFGFRPAGVLDRLGDLVAAYKAHYGGSND